MNRNQKGAKVIGSEYLKIRYYVLNMILRSGDKPVKLPSLSELEKIFSVSRPTICKALKTLIQDGYIIARRGLGSFTNPDSISFSMPRDRKFPLIGILIEDGMISWYNETFGGILGNLILNITQMHAGVQLINLSSNDPDQVFRDLMNSNIDALIWHSFWDKTPIVRRLQAEGKKVIYSTIVDKPGFFYLDFFTYGFKQAERLISEGKRKIVYLPGDVPWDTPLPGIRKAYEKHGIPQDEITVLTGGVRNSYENFRKMLSGGYTPDAVFATCSTQDTAFSLLHEFHIDTKKNCEVLYSEGFRYSNPNQDPNKVHADHLTEALKMLLNGIEDYPESLRRTEIIMETGRTPAVGTEFAEKGSK